MTRLSAATLSRLPANIRVPAYDVAHAGVGIVHLGVGNFHRAHQAFYTDAVLADDPAWGICGVNLRHPELRNALAPQDHLYTLASVGGPTGDDLRVIGALRECLVLPEQPARVLERLTDPDTRIVSLTVTEKGYGRRPDGQLALEDPALRADLTLAQTPASTLGLLLAACVRRQTLGRRGFTVLSCDNLASNGEMTRSLLLACVGQLPVLAGWTASRAAGLATWIERELSFPNGMVDRIVPRTSESWRDRVQGLTGLHDAWPVVTEPFHQWVLEDRFVAGRPPWQLAGVQFVDRVRPFEEMKLRLLNAAHSAIAYLAVPAGLATVDAAIRQPDLRAVIESFWRHEAIPALPADLRAPAQPYCESLIERFANPTVDHRTEQIAQDGSQKLPLRLLPTLRARLAAGLPHEGCALVIAAWIRFLRGRSEGGEVYQVVDPMTEILRARLNESGPSARDQTEAVLGLEQIFDEQVRGHESLRASVARHFEGLAHAGTLGWLARLRDGAAPDAGVALRYGR